ncbi:MULTISPECIES: flagellar protein FliT [Clostridium]|uniref:Flagellar protein FliT n=2 Tax=Clostridium TaxID=1485 RepID=A0A2T0AX32_9CLOT|nr:flagellar protein FliT [Clostridium thermopalmarium]PRR75377.1 Flagellar protein FliT [Clostridium thermopalmarium DSM 5974]PVZ24279.1 protein FliT [Clostridium thermopalmarium DSM 5974]
MELKDGLKEYKNITLDIISSVEKENYDALEQLMSNRQNIINTMDKLDYSKEEFIEVCKELDILMIEQKLLELIKEKRASLINNMNKLVIRNNANKSYNKIYSIGSVFFNKKI